MNMNRSRSRSNGQNRLVSLWVGVIGIEGCSVTDRLPLIAAFSSMKEISLYRRQLKTSDNSRAVKMISNSHPVPVSFAAASSVIPLSVYN
jgi:hypothetical protein